VDYARGGALGARNVLCRTTANCDGSLFVTRYVSRKQCRLSRHLAAGILAGNSDRLLCNFLNLLKNSPKLESLPGTKTPSAAFRRLPPPFAAFRRRSRLAVEHI